MRVYRFKAYFFKTLIIVGQYFKSFIAYLIHFVIIIKTRFFITIF